MSSRDINRANFINTKLLGRKREPIDVRSEEDPEIENIMKTVETETIIDREEVMEACVKLLNEPLHVLDKDFAAGGLTFAFNSSMPPQMVALDASQAWIVYWIANSMMMIDPSLLTNEIKRKIVRKLFLMSKDNGPFGGGESQLPHIASTYAAINALALCDNIDNCWNKINRDAIYKWLLSLKQPDGSFTTCNPIGERDTRGVYCALSIASLLNIMSDELTEGVVEYLQQCQTYEGGFGATRLGDEAHGGYTFCATASLVIMNKLNSIDIEKLMEWCAARQCTEEMGLCGRSNKLVDGCYSFWVGGTAAMLEANDYHGCLKKEALRKYILNCCQSKTGIALRDKPGKNGDFYHTNYVLLGLSITESKFYYHGDDKTNRTPFDILSKSLSVKEVPSGLAFINPVYGIPNESLQEFHEHFI
ncbi:CAAX farnesyltransferase (FTase) subunit beta [Maudiozyma exigua]|uniref:Protein farnesyltransferase subunit beta n=1 Tax=Maudiozyma exigua TaxID=34358 RepID=A0A9P6WD41_MAUEX|nr:CAAX farnesyltransferase (FTase) subunit beta [Kazachstania exigua]